MLVLVLATNWYFGAPVLIFLLIILSRLFQEYAVPIIEELKFSLTPEGRKADKNLREMTSIWSQMQLQNRDLDSATPDFFDDIGELDPEILEEILSLLDQGEDEKAARLFMIKLAEKRSEETDSF